MRRLMSVAIAVAAIVGLSAPAWVTTEEENLMIDIHYHGHDAFRIVDPKAPDAASGPQRGAGKQIYFDPYKLPEGPFRLGDSLKAPSSVEGLPKADVIFISHSHGDHCSPDDVKKIRTDATVIVATADSAAKLGGKVTVVKPGDAIDVAGLKVKVVPAYNINKFRSPGVPFHPKESGWVGYVVTLSDGATVYHAGDSDATGEMKALKVDVALLPVSGVYVMTAAEAVEAANAMMPKLAIPMHYGVVAGSDADAETFRKGFKGTTRILKPER
jgi:L-ascorbate metabolism protein UlaG (beta-lactamase superfamily)